MTTETQDVLIARFIARAREVHGDKYTYERVVYKNQLTKLIVTCPKHGDWLVRPHNHIHQRNGCPRCR